LSPFFELARLFRGFWFDDAGLWFSTSFESGKLRGEMIVAIVNGLQLWVRREWYEKKEDVCFDAVYL
jgi:hypothetical protein